MPPNELPRLSSTELVALAVAYYGEPDNLNDVVSDEVWNSLHERGLVQTARDFTGEGTTVTTRAGFELLVATLEGDRVAS